MRRQTLLALGAAALLILLTGCTATPEPSPTGSASTSPSPSPSPTPTAEPVVEPTPAFDVSCDDVATAMAGLVGEPNSPMIPALSLTSAAATYPGPVQYAYQRAGGIGCSAGDVERWWQVTMVPGAQAVVDGTTSRGGGIQDVGCDSYLGEGRCAGDMIEGDVLISLFLLDPAVTAADTDAVSAAMRGLATAAAASSREVELADSAIVGVDCTRFLTAEELAARLGTEVVIISQFGGWDVTSEVYSVVNGSRICYYASDSNEYTSTHYLTITTLPGGAWAFERMDGTAVEVEGADAAVSGIDVYGRPVLDLRVGTDWIRLTTTDHNGEPSIVDLPAVATDILKNFTVGRPAPQ